MSALPSTAVIITVFCLTIAAVVPFVVSRYLELRELLAARQDPERALSEPDRSEQERYAEMARHQDQLAADARHANLPELAAIQEDLASTYRGIAHSFTKEQA